jgi:hypothetical protein
MINQCVNPACRTEFRLFNSGDLYAVDRPHGYPEYFWVCSSCASKFNVSVDPMGLVSLRPRPEGHPASKVLAHSNLRLVAHATRRLPWRRAIPAGTHPDAASGGGPTHAVHL